MSRYTRARNASERTHRVALGDGQRDFDRAGAVGPPADMPAVGAIREFVEVESGGQPEDVGPLTLVPLASTPCPHRFRFYLLLP